MDLTQNSVCLELRICCSCHLLEHRWCKSQTVETTMIWLGTSKMLWMSILITLLSGYLCIKLSSGTVKAGSVRILLILLMSSSADMPPDESSSCLALSLYFADSADLLCRRALQRRVHMQGVHRWQACGLALTVPDC